MGAYMKKIALLILLLIVGISLVFAVSGLNKDQKIFLRSCTKNCSTQKMLDMRACNAVADVCKAGCAAEKRNCTAQINVTSCVDSCVLTFNETNPEHNLTPKQIDAACKFDCRLVKSNLSRECTGASRECHMGCQDDKQACKKQAINDSIACKANCLDLAYNYTFPYNGTIPINGTNSTNTTGVQLCPEERPHNCIDLFDPVCTNRNRTYSNACEACKRGATKNYTVGACV